MSWILKLFYIIFIIDYYQHGIDLETPKLIQQPAGWDLRLKCGIRGNHAEFMSSSDVHWDFRVIIQGKLMNNGGGMGEWIIWNNVCLECLGALSILKSHIKGKFHL